MAAMETVDAVMLSRIQFAANISFHILFPTITIALGWVLLFFKLRFLRTGNDAWLSAYFFWVKVFALSFAMGVVSGVTMSFQFGTNWPGYMNTVGNIAGPLLAYEIMTAFFLEASFLGIMLFGRKRVGNGLHMFAVAMVAAGTLISATWIISANSWMQTPAGYTTNEAGQFVPVDWWAIIFNPSFPYRLVHTVLAAFLTTAFAVGAVGAYHLLRDNTNRQARTMFSMAMWMAALVTPVQIFAGDQHGLNTLEHQPAKIAAIEGHYETHVGAPLILVGIPDDKAEETHFALEIPKLGSLILGHSWDAEIKGLKAFPPDERPPAFLPFWTFRIMVGLGILMLVVGLWSLWARFRKTLFTSTWLHRAALLMGPSGFVAVLAGWYTTEVGRQPYTVYGLLRTSDSLSNVDAEAIGASLLAFIVVYFVVFGAGVFYILRIVSKTPEGEKDELHDGPTRTAGITPVQQLEAEGKGNA